MKITTKHIAQIQNAFEVSAPGTRISPVTTLITLATPSQRRKRGGGYIVRAYVCVGEDRCNSMTNAARGAQALAVESIAHRYRRKSIPRLIADLAKQVAEEFE